jgi:flagellar protein FlbT
MTSVMRLTLKAGEKVYINGAVLQSDRKVSLQLLNDATFLLGAHVLQADEAVSPLRQLYFVVQTLLIDPAGEGDVLELFGRMMTSLQETFENEDILQGLKDVGEMIAGGQVYGALKRIRGLYALEDTILPDRAIAAATAGQEGVMMNGRSSGRSDDEQCSAEIHAFCSER